MPKSKSSTKKPKKPLDTGFAKRGRGRPARVRPSEIANRAYDYRLIFNQVWDRLWPLLSKAQTQEEVFMAFQAGSNPYERDFVPVLTLAHRVLRDPKFPKTRDAQINFLAGSLAALGRISPRRSRDICAEVRANEKRAHHILRFEYWIECSCGYKGKSRDHACPKCAARIAFNGPFIDLPFAP
jgi:hypothetical protein